MKIAPHGRLASYSLIFLFGIATALALGKDFNSDSLSYHFYAGYSAVENRLDADYFAASVQAYLNPYAQLPFYLMVKYGFAPQLIVGLLALFHALNLVFVVEIARLLNRRPGGGFAFLPVGMAVFLAFCNPVFLLELGSTYSEITTSVPVLAGWYLLIRGFSAPRCCWVAVAGLLIGLAVALKLSNLLFSVTALPLLLLAPGSLKARGRAVLAFAGGGVAGALLGGGWWAWQLWEKFGNPLFPMFNQIFRSPAFTDGAITHTRFLPDSALGLLFKPFLMALPGSGIHLETVAPDVRYAALLVLLGWFGWKYMAPARPGREPLPQDPQRRLMAALTASVLLAFVLWLASSGNSRYFLPMSCLAAVLLASLAARFSAQPRHAAYLLVPLVLVQGALAFNTAHRWAPAGWGKTWFELDIPAQLQQEPALYLHLNAQPASFLLPYLPPGSSMINPSGQFVVDENTPAVQDLLHKHRGHVRVMRRFGTAEFEAKAFDMFLVRFGVEADMSSCLDMRFLHRSAGGGADRHRHYISCKVKPLDWSEAERDQFRASQQRVNALFDRLEAACPHLFQPRGLRNEGDGKQFWRNYVNTDIVLQQYESGLVTYRNVFLNSADYRVGFIDELGKAIPGRASLCP